MEEKEPMASLIESVRKLHGPHVVAHDNGYDVDVICEECTRLRLEALDQAAGNGEDLSYSAESVRVSYPCTTRIVAGTTSVEGKEEAARMRLERLVIQREEIEEQAERLDTVIALIRRDLGEDTGSTDPGNGPDEPDDPGDGSVDDPVEDRGTHDVARAEDAPDLDEAPEGDEALALGGADALDETGTKPPPARRARKPKSKNSAKGSEPEQDDAGDEELPATPPDPVDEFDF
ncbi:MAG: hypothetical protein L0G94_13640 [Brachybacterium sp.]|uniref:hypothetical protein n=1 Tax=Brachybacterium sp. TaxID=1891286 RepID=UPI002649577C|nr:hypothetical protein [Brachybacterium sp.]MDN5687695.1 hypothetical protein [Brachybacterium sp.]